MSRLDLPQGALLFPLPGDLDGLGQDHRDALRVAHGFGGGPPPDRLLVSSAALVLLQLWLPHACARSPAGGQAEARERVTGFCEVM
jgi:hypothetical protein